MKLNSDFQYKNNSYQFLRSAFSDKGSFISTDSVIDWLNRQNHFVKLKIEKIAFATLDKWNLFNDRIRHESGKFFSIDGIHIQTNWGPIQEWDQPIINQPEIGYLGFIAKEFDGILHFLVQAKIEPGNVNYIQLSPTLQATRSNYSQVHKGKKPLYLEYFQNVKPNQILLDQLQSEQGARFLKKETEILLLR